MDWRSLKNRGVRDRLDSAFSVVDREYGVTRLLDPEGESPDFVFQPSDYYSARALRCDVVLLLLMMMPLQMSINWMLSPSSSAGCQLRNLVSPFASPDKRERLLLWAACTTKQANAWKTTSLNGSTSLFILQQRQAKRTPPKRALLLTHTNTLPQRNAIFSLCLVSFLARQVGI